VRRLTVWLTWSWRNADGVIALVSSLIIVILDLSTDLKPETTDSGILFVLGVLAVAMLRDRERREDIEQGVIANNERLSAVEATVVKVEHVLDDNAMVRSISAAELRRRLEQERRSTDQWYFRGGTGTYIRAATLPGCINHARDERRRLRVRLEIIDPTNEAVCASYARFRQSFAGDQRSWTVERTRHESYATIVAACWHRQRYDLLDIRIGLSQSMPTLRWDMSEHCLFITNEHRRAEILLVERGRPLYDYIATELDRSCEQARQVPLEQARTLWLSDEPTVEEVQRLFSVLGMPLPSTFSEGNVTDIIVRALRAENMYDR